MWWRTSLSSVSIQSPRICHRSSLPTAYQVLFHNGYGFGAFLIQHVHIFEYEWCLLESNEAMNVCDLISLLNAQLQQWVMHELLATRYKNADELRCIHLFHFVHNVVLRCVLLDSIGVHARLLYGKEWQIIELVVEFHWCLDITLDKESILAECLEWLNPSIRVAIDFLHHFLSLKHTNQFIRHHSLHDSPIQAVRIEIVDVGQETGGIPCRL